MRELRNRFQVKQRLAPKTQSDLVDAGKWLSWDLFGEAVESLQLEFNEAVRDSESSIVSRLAHDLLLLRIYQCSPLRSSEIRCLQYYAWDDVIEAKGRKIVSRWVADGHINVVTKRPMSCWQTLLGNYKAVKRYGVDETLYYEETFPELNDAFDQYLLPDGFRWNLVEGEKSRYIFVDRKGKPFGSADSVVIWPTCCFA